MSGKNISLIFLNIILAVVLVIGGYKFWLAYRGSAREEVPLIANIVNEPVPTNGGKIKEDKPPCAQVLTYALNPETKKCEKFSTPCDAPPTWERCEPLRLNGGSAQKTEEQQQANLKESVIKDKSKKTVVKESDQESAAAEKPSEKIYLYYFQGGQPQGDCTNTVKVERPLDPAYELEEVSSLVTLLLPLPEELVAQGYYSEIPPFTHLRNLSISKGVATADFNGTLNTGGGSCSLAARRAQIENTLLQFPDIKKVIITVDGGTEEILKP